MDEPTLVAEAEALKRAYAALNRGDIPAMIEAFDPQVEWTDPVNSPMSGTYRGLAEVEAHFTRARATWAEGACEPERLLIVGDKIAVRVHVRVRLKEHTEWVEGDLTDVYTFRNGKVIQGRSFADRDQALDWVAGDRD